MIQKITSFMKKELYNKNLNLTLAVIKINNVNYLCISCADSGQRKNIILSHITYNRNCNIFAREDMFENVVFENPDESSIVFKTSLQSE